MEHGIGAEISPTLDLGPAGSNLPARRPVLQAKLRRVGITSTRSAADVVDALWTCREIVSLVEA